MIVLTVVLVLSAYFFGMLIGGVTGVIGAAGLGSRWASPAAMTGGVVFGTLWLVGGLLLARESWRARRRWQTLIAMVTFVTIGIASAYWFAIAARYPGEFILV